MSTSEIIEFKGRKFQRLGIMEFPQCGQWYLLGRLPIVATRNHADFETKIKRELLRELPAETPAPATAQYPRCPKCGSSNVDFWGAGKNLSGEVLCGDCKEQYFVRTASLADFAQFFPASGLLAEAEEALRCIWAGVPDGVRRSLAAGADNLRTKSIVVIPVLLEALRKVESVLARIQAAKEKP